MARVFYSESDRFEAWRDALAEAVPDLDVYDWDAVPDPAAVEFALVWTPPHGSLRRFPNLKAILNLGAGVDALLKDDDLPPGVPIVRMVDDDLAYLLNAGRGGHQVEADILAALDSGQLAGATLDVFRTEPLPPDSPFWTHPKVTVTPHNASVAHPRSAIRHVADSIRRVRAGEPLRHVVTREAGY